MNFGQRQQFERVKKNLANVTIDLAGHQIDGHVQDKEGKNLLSVAIESNNQKVFDAIMALPDSVRKDFFEVPDERGRHPVESASESHNTHYLDRLLDADCELVNQQNKKTGMSLLHAVVRRETFGIDNDVDREKAKLIRLYRPDPHIRNNRGETPDEAVNRILGIRHEQIKFEL